jgi:hypothetical protein
VLMRRRLAVRPLLEVGFAAVPAFPEPFAPLLVLGDALAEEAPDPASPSILSTPENGSASLVPAILGGTQFWLR